MQLLLTKIPALIFTVAMIYRRKSVSNPHREAVKRGAQTQLALGAPSVGRVTIAVYSGVLLCTLTLLPQCPHRQKWWLFAVDKFCQYLAGVLSI